MSILQDHPVQGDAKEKESLAAGFAQLESTDTGKPIAQALRDHSTTIKFGQTEDAAIAQFDPATNEITIHNSQKDASPAVLAAYLAHEGTHVQSGNPTSVTDALDQEYGCFKAQTEVWNVVKGTKQDPELDYDAAMIARGEIDAKADIRRRYGDEYFTRWDGKL